MIWLTRYKFSALYFLAIVFVNVMWGRFGEYMLLRTPWDGVTWAPLACVVGLWFVLRDYAQQELGNRVLLVMVAGMVATYFMAGPGLALSSCVAFAIGELCDWFVFSRVKGSFAKRMMASSLVSVPIDTVIFLWLSDVVQVIPGQKMLSWPTTTTEILSKLAAAAFIYYRIKGRAQPALAAA